MADKSKEHYSSPPFSEVKTTQVACLILKTVEKTVEYEWLVKLMYDINRRALDEWGRPAIYDQAYSLPLGQVLSTTLDLAKDKAVDLGDYWNKYIQKIDDYHITLIGDCEDGELSDDEVDLITRMAGENKDISTFDLRDKHHNEYKEYKKPTGLFKRRIPTEITDILDALGLNDDEISAIASEIQEDAHIMAYLKS